MILWVLDCLEKRTRSNLKTSLLGRENYDEHMSQLFLTFTVETEGIIRALKSVVGRHKKQRGTCLLPGSVCLHNDKTVYKKFANSDDANHESSQLSGGICLTWDSTRILPIYSPSHFRKTAHIELDKQRTDCRQAECNLRSTSGIIKLVSIQLWFLWPLIVSEERASVLQCLSGSALYLPSYSLKDLIS